MIFFKEIFLLSLILFFGRVAAANENCVNLVESAVKGDVSLFVSEANLIKKRHLYQECSVPLMNFWNLNLEKYQGLDREFLLKDDVRIEIASILFQAKNAGKIKIDESPIIDYARSINPGKSCLAFNKALMILSSTRVVSDRDLILRSIYSEETCSFNAAVLAFVLRCDVDDKFLERVSLRIKDGEKKKFLVHAWEKYRDFRERICA